MATTTTVVVTALSPSLEDAFKDVDLVALDIEGVDLGRNGQISLIQLSPSPAKCFLLDVLGHDKDSALVGWLRSLLESKSVLKIIHDCRMDSDALKYRLDIELTHCHDTSCWHLKLRGEPDANLNTVLVANGIKPNTQRDSSVYASNHAFWATRPLTSCMIEWAAGDVCSLFHVHAKQITAPSHHQVAAEALSETYLNLARTASTETLCVHNPGAFIGRGGANLRALMKRTNTLVYPRGDRKAKCFLVYYHSEAALTAVKLSASV
jgi:exonuclease 3'-5' domain-containing protein 1